MESTYVLITNMLRELAVFLWLKESVAWHWTRLSLLPSPNMWQMAAKTPCVDHIVDQYNHVQER